MKVFLCGLNEKVCKGKGRKILKKRKKELELRENRLWDPRDILRESAVAEFLNYLKC